MDIRGYIKSNFKDDNEVSIRESIDESIKSKDEILLPGLGVFFELIWNNADEYEKKNILSKIHSSINT